MREYFDVELERQRRHSIHMLRSLFTKSLWGYNHLPLLARPSPSKTFMDIVHWQRNKAVRRTHGKIDSARSQYYTDSMLEIKRNAGLSGEGGYTLLYNIVNFHQSNDNVIMLKWYMLNHRATVFEVLKIINIKQNM